MEKERIQERTKGSSQISKGDEVMKFGKLRTLRGQIAVTGGGVARKNLVAADGLINYGLRIISFTVWNKDAPTATAKFTSILSLDTTIAGSDMNAGDNRQFAWTFFATSSTTSAGTPVRTIIDPDHIVNRDLFLTMDNSSTGTYNYLIEAQVVELTDDEAIVTIIKETSQS
jgi:hypothetical protein